MTKVAIMIDGGFYRQRAYKLYGNVDAKKRAAELESYCKEHLNDKNENRELYRIYYYDCPPVNKKVFHPLLKTDVDLSKTPLNAWMNTFLEELKRKRKFCLRLGTLAEEQAEYNIRTEVTRKILNGEKTIESLSEADFELSVTQKGVDMKIGVDIASLAYKKQVDQIILISGDSDFVPAAKLARREGIDFILDPMRAHIKNDLFEHIDGMRTKAPNNGANVRKTIQSP